jgi:DNA-binding NarL/FixJ family response regulator
MRVVIADDEVLLREGLDRLLTEAGFEVVGKAATPDELRRRVELDRPDVAIVDIKMPPTHTDEGLVAAEEIRRLDPSVGVLVLSHYLESRYAMRLLHSTPNGSGTCSRNASPTSRCSPMPSGAWPRANVSSTPPSWPGSWAASATAVRSPS